MWLIDKIAEQRIAEAMQRGEFDDLPGKGRRIVLDDDRLVPEELRVAYRLMKNAGFLPPELELRREISSVEGLLCQAVSAVERGHLNKRLNFLLLKLDQGGCASPAIREAAYHNKLSRRLLT